MTDQTKAGTSDAARDFAWNRNPSPLHSGNSDPYYRQAYESETRRQQEAAEQRRKAENS